MEPNIRFTSYIAQLLLEWEMFRAKVIHKKHILCSITFFPENRAVCEIMWKNTEEPGKP